MQTDSASTPAFHFEPARYPQIPGCFLIKDAAGRALLVGGTVNLRRRLATLFDESARQHPPTTRVQNKLDDRIPRMVALASEIEVFLLPGNTDCPALANSLIARYKPLFNLAVYMEPSGSSFITQTADTFPRLLSGQKGPGGDCYGPFPSATRDLLLKSVNESFGLRTCNPMPRRACISYQLKICCAPCEGRVSREEYAERVAQAARFLSAPGKELLEMLEAQMQSAADGLDFGRARRISDQIEALKPAIEKLAEERGRESGPSQDALYLGQNKVFIVHYAYGTPRDMALLDFPTGTDPDTFFLQRYQQEAPGELIVGGDPLPDPGRLAEALTSANGYPVSVTIPGADRPNVLLETARINHAYRVNGMIPRPSSNQPAGK